MPNFITKAELDSFKQTTSQQLTLTKDEMKKGLSDASTKISSLQTSIVTLSSSNSKPDPSASTTKNSEENSVASLLLQKSIEKIDKELNILTSTSAQNEIFEKEQEEKIKKLVNKVETMEKKISSLSTHPAPSHAQSNSKTSQHQEIQTNDDYQHGVNFALESLGANVNYLLTSPTLYTKNKKFDKFMCVWHLYK